MPTTYAGITGTGQVTNLIQTAWDRLLEFQLRAQPLFRQVADKRATQQTQPGSSVVFQLYPELSPATTPLTESQDPDAVALGNTTMVTVTLQEYGNSMLATRKLEMLGLSDIDPAMANLIAFNAADTVDVLVQTVLAGGTGAQVLNESAASGVQSGTTVSTLTNTGTQITSRLARYAAAGLRSNKVVPRRGNLYAAFLHPKVSADLRSETGAGSWRQPHEYSAPDQIWAGEIGQYESFYWIENPRCINAQVGAGSGASQTRVFNTYFMGSQALAEGVAIEPHIVIGEVVDKLKRFRPVGWHALLGWALYRPTALYQANLTSTLQPNQ